MTSNSKLTREQKADLREFKAAMRKNMAFGHAGLVTVLIEVTGNVTRVATSVASPDEKKIRAKVGEWYAMNRFNYGEFVVMPTPDYGQGSSPEEIAEYIASILA